MARFVAPNNNNNVNVMHGARTHARFIIRGVSLDQ